MFLDAANTTIDRVWHPSPTTRGTWDIYLSCGLLIILCIWTAIHMNPPAPGEHWTWQTCRKIGYAYLAFVIPELVAVNSW